MLAGFRGDGPWCGEVQASPASITTAVEQEGALEWRSSAATHAGNVRKNNGDAHLARPDVGLWAVADGMGGHSHGEVASRMIIDALAAVTITGALEARVGQVARSLRMVNTELCHLARTRSDGLDAGSTIVALVLGSSGGAAAVWAGDSRLYRLREGEFTPMTRDHALEVEPSASAQPDSPASAGGAITRAVGGEDTLEVDVAYFDVKAGDRYLLCSDGVYTELSPAMLRQALETQWDSDPAREILRAVLSRDARDNATAVVVDVESPSSV
jgi:type VI secretion system protein ImpM